MALHMHRVVQTPALRFGVCFALLLATASSSSAQKVLERKGATILIESYAPNIVRVSLSLRREDALKPPGYGVLAKPSTEGWSDVSVPGVEGLQSATLTVTLPKVQDAEPSKTDTKRSSNDTAGDIAKYFSG